jgi:exopolyphosphatase/guanosine-5'-triphosphate,3'-diphosphate pyrophosphatase
MRAGVIDIGSNSIKLAIGENSKDEIKILESLKNVVPIGKHTFFKEYMSQETINQTISVLEKYKKTLEEYQVTNVTVIATTAVREARNKDIFVDTVFRKTGFSIEVLTPGDVIYYIDSYLYHKLKGTYPTHEKNLMIGELGAGSLDVSAMEKGFTIMNAGLAIGTIRIRQIMNKLDGSLEEINDAVTEYIENELAFLKRLVPSIAIDDVILIDESYAPYFSNILPEKKTTEKFFKLEAMEAQAMYSQLKDRNIDQIAREFKIPSDVAYSITGYILILNSLFRLIDNNYLYILETSLAEAILANTILDLELSDKYNKTNQLISVATSVCQRYSVDLNHAKQVAMLSESLFDNLRESLGLKKKDILYLILAAYLHDIGLFIHNRAHHKHAEYIISCLNLFRLSQEDIKIIACIARYHRKGVPQQSHFMYHSLASDKQILVQKLSAILRIANALDRSHKQKVSKVEVKFNKSDDVAVTVSTAKNFLLEKSDFNEKKEWFEQITGNKINLVTKTA